MGAIGCAKAADARTVQSLRAAVQRAPGCLVLWVAALPEQKWHRDPGEHVVWDGEKCWVSTTEEQGVPVATAWGCTRGRGAEVQSSSSSGCGGSGFNAVL